MWKYLRINFHVGVSALVERVVCVQLKVVLYSVSSMKTSRIARETARIAERVSQIDNVGPRQTRSLASLHRFAANGVALFSETDISTVKQEECSDDDSSLSSLSTSATVDIEDLPTLNPPSQKRKRGIETSISTRPTAGSSPCKTEIQAEDGKVRKSSSKRSQKASNNAGEVEIHSPANWEEIYDSVKEMRKKVLAPVDTMGCETLAEENITPRVSTTVSRIPCG